VIPPAERGPFVAVGRARWSRLERLLDARSLRPQDWLELAALYRAVCADLATARGAGEPTDVQGYLDELAARSHARLYAGTGGGDPRSVWTDALHGFPRELRAQAPFFLVSLVLFFGPLLVGFFGALLDPTYAARILPEEQLRSMEAAYAEDLSRGTGGDAHMAGFYVYNNVGIALRCFATGILFGGGPLFYLVYNGLVIGTTAGHLTAAGVGGNLLTFVSGHSSWELLGICVAGAGGLRMGWALVSTAGRTRIGSLSAAAPSLYRLVLGATVMLLVAAAIEGFWSAGPVPPPGKWAFGGLQLGIVTAWLALGGRDRRGAA
jgi:uncharacterized membrane protein SpoIIM required for sporulation